MALMATATCIKPDDTECPGWNKVSKQGYRVNDYSVERRAFTSMYAASINADKAATSTSSPGLSFTCRMNLPTPSSKPCGSASSAPWKKPTLTWDVKAST